MSRNTVRLTISPTQAILDLVSGGWPLKVPKHRLMRIALERGLQALAQVEPAEFIRIVTQDAVASAGITNPDPPEPQKRDVLRS